MKRYKISFEYLGLGFLGSQIQKNEPTIQGELEKAISTLTRIKTKVYMSGRTDANVSAKCQTAHFDSCEIADENKFLIKLNSILPEKIRVFEIEPVVASFHAQKQATYRHYQYKINNSLFKKSVFDECVIHTRLKLDENRMNQAINHLVGEFDFSSFKSVSDNPSKICTIYYANVRRDAEYILIDIVGNRFLYNMVRAIVGTLLLIESKNLNPSFMKDVLNSKERKQAGANVDAKGLTLIKTGYDDPILYVNNIRKANK